MGDFNALLDPMEKQGEKPIDFGQCSKFHECLTNCSLFDLGFKGNPYTWQWTKVQERLDRGVANVDWGLRFLEASIYHLPALKSDHCPLLITIGSKSNPCNKEQPFRFMAPWLLHEGSKDVVLEAWAGDDDLRMKKVLFLQIYL